MTVSQGRLLNILIGSLILGIFLGVVYDFFRIRRISYSSGIQKSGERKRLREKIECLIIFFEDILYSLICAVSVSIFIFYMNSGRLRGLALFGCFAGFWVYYNTVGRIVLFCSERIIRFIKYILRKIYSIFLRPLLLILMFSVKITIGKLFLIVFTRIKMRLDIRKAEKGLLILDIKNRGREDNEKTFKYIRKSSGSGVHSVLHGHHNKDAV